MDDLKLIKKHYGEKMAHLCRELFPTLLETPSKLFKIISSRFAYSKLLYDDLINEHMQEDFKELIYSLSGDKPKEVDKGDKTPQELLDEAGYILYECKNESDIQRFRKYYAKGEELCTFHGGRLKRCHVFFAVKKNVDEIKREDFLYPARQDEYGTSVISIQFEKGRTNTLSIKNRYNHTVAWPDATFSNNLDNIIPGLTKAFEKKYNLNLIHQPQDIEFKGYVFTNDEKYYKYYYEEDNIYYCPNNIIIDFFAPKQYDKSKYLIFENFILNLQEKTIELFSPTYSSYDCFIETLGTIEKIEIKSNKEDKTKKIIINEDIEIVINNANRIISYTNPHVTEIGDAFLSIASEVKEVNLPNVEKIGYDFIPKAEHIQKVNLPKVKKIGSSFLFSSKDLEKIELPEVERIDSSFMPENIGLKELSLPKCKEIRYYFLQQNTMLEKIDFPNVESIGNFFLPNNSALVTLSLPKVKYIENNFLCGSTSGNTKLEEIDLPEVISIDDNFLRRNKSLRIINLPKVEKIGTCFISDNKDIREVILPNIKNIGSYFLNENITLTKISLPNVEGIGNYFLYNNGIIDTVYLPNVNWIGNYFLNNNRMLKELNLPSTTKIANSFMQQNEILSSLRAPILEAIGDNFLVRNKKLKELDIPSIKYIGTRCLISNRNIKTEEDKSGITYIKK